MAKRRIPVKSFDTNKEFQDFIDVEKEWMYNRIVSAIREAYDLSQDYADIMEAKISESMSIISMKSDRDEWCVSLNLALKWYESQEKYEICADLVKLISNIQDSDSGVKF
jgi:hypothetical protein